MHKKFSFLLAAMMMLGAAGCSTAAASSTGTQSSSSSSSSSSLAASSTSSDDDSEKKDDEIEFDSDIVSDSNINLSSYSKPVEIASGGEYTVTGTSDQMLIIDAKKQDVTITLKDVDIESSIGPAIYVRKAASVTIVLEGDNTISSPSATDYDTLNACLYSKADLVIDGTGSLTVNSGYEHGIKAKDTAIFKNGTLDITAPQDGIHINEDGTFENGTYTISAGDEGIQSEMGLTFEDGTYSVTATGDAIRCETALVIHDGDFTIVTQNEGLESKDTLEINGGTFDIQAADDGINAANSLLINDGDLTIVSSGNDAVDSNGTLQLSGGRIVAVGLRTPEMAFDVDNTPFIIDGGDILGLGSSITYVTQASQNVIYIGSLSGTVSSVEVKEGDTSILSFDVPSSSSTSSGGFGMMGGSSSTNITISSSKLKTGSTYSIYINGSLLDTVTISSTSTTIGSVSTMGGGFGGGAGMDNGNFGGNMPGKGFGR